MHRAFTLVEVMVVVAVIGLLAALAVPSIIKARESAQNGRFIADLRTARGAFELYCLETGRYPADRTPGVVPTGMEEYLAKFPWTERNCLGGLWDWDYQQFGCVAGVSVYQPSVPVAQLQKIDAIVDDGDLSDGMFRARASGYISIIE